MSVTKAILAGHLVSTVPIVGIMLAARWIGLAFLGRQWWIIFLMGFMISWAWWAYIIPRWRRWALQKGAPAEPLHKAAVLTGLEWMRGSVFAETEMKVKEDK